MQCSHGAPVLDDLASAASPICHAGLYLAASPTRIANQVYLQITDGVSMSTATDGQANGLHVGRVVQVIGSTFDAEFEEGHLPEICMPGASMPATILVGEDSQ